MQSLPHMIRRENLKLCQRSDVATCIIRCEYDLGDVESIRVWHDNTGSDPSW